MRRIVFVVSVVTGALVASLGLVAPTSARSVGEPAAAVSSRAQVADRVADRLADRPADEIGQRRRRGPRLVIPALGVDAGIIATGVSRNGQLAVGGSVRDVYRWRAGVRPGQRGSAVLAGHTWSRGDGVFDRLGTLRPGAVVGVGRHRFRVRRVQKVRGLRPRQVRALFSDLGRPRLVLITCGDRDDATGVYRTRILVKARKVRRR